MTGIAARIAEIEPDVIVIDLENPNRDMLENMFQLSRAVKRPIAMFVDRSDTASIEAAVEAGVSAYVVDGLRKERVKPILDMAISRFNAFSRMARELEEARTELESRKLVDRAKGILMKSRGLSEEDAYALAAQDGDEPEPQDRRDRAEPGHRRRPARAGRGRMTCAASDQRRLHAAARQRAAGRGAGDGLCRSARASTCCCVRETLLGQYPRPAWLSAISTSRTCWRRCRSPAISG